MKHKPDKRELIAAALMMLLGIGVAVGSVQYRVGSLERMGPGYFPLLLGVCLIAVAALMFATSAVPAEEDPAAHAPPEWRAWGYVIAGIVAFMVLGRYGGLVPATFALVLLAALGDKGNSIKAALLLATGITVLAVLVFNMLLKLSFPLFTWG